MKKITFLVASIFLLGGGVANATEKNSFSHERRLPVDFRNAEPVVFMERGVEFFVFPDGQFDFNTRPGNNAGMYFKPGKKNHGPKAYGAQSRFRNENVGVRVEHDNFGRVRRIGNVMVNYDAYDRIKRIGSVYMSYNRFALEQVGGLQIMYNRRGEIVDMIGSVKGGRAYQYSQSPVGYERDYDRDYGQYSDDQDVYYRKAQKDDTKVVGSVDVRIGKRF